jgi:hypothetical protein
MWLYANVALGRYIMKICEADNTLYSHETIACGI